jgi:hypothetical protein
MTVERKRLRVLLKESFVFFTRNILPLTKGVLSAYLPLLLVFSIYALNLAGMDKTAEELDPVTAVRFFFFSIAFFMAVIIFSLFYQIALIKTIVLVDRQESLDVGSLFRESWSLLRGYLGVVLRVLVRVFLWTLVLIVPGIIFAIFYSYAGMAFIVEGKEGYRALVYSKQIIKPAVWKFLGNMLAVSLLVFPAYILMSGVIEMIFGPVSVEGESRVSLPGIILGNLTSVVVGIYPMTFLYFLYQELKKPFAAEETVYAT